MTMAPSSPRDGYRPSTAIASTQVTTGIAELQGRHRAGAECSCQAAAAQSSAGDMSGKGICGMVRCCVPACGGGGPHWLHPSSPSAPEPLAPDDLVEGERDVKQRDVVERNVEGHEAANVHHACS